MKVLILFFLMGCNVIKFFGNEDNISEEFFYNPNSEPFIEVNFPEQKRTKYISDESLIRTVNFNFLPFGELWCSSDDAQNFVECGDGYVWEVADYNTEHIVEYRGDNGNIFSTTFTPSTELPNISFLTCTFEVTANESFAAFYGRTFSDPTVACIGDGVQISNAGADSPISFAFPNITVIARQGDVATFSSAKATDSIFDDVSRGNIDYIGLKVTGNQVQQTAFNITGTDVDIEDVEIDLTGSASAGIKTSTNGNLVNIRSVNINLTDTGSGEGIYTQNSNINIYDSEIQSGYNAVYFWKNSTSTYVFNASNSVFIGNKINPLNGSSPGVLETFINEGTNSHQINLTDSQVISNGGAAFLVKNAAGIADINLSRTVVKRGGSVNFDGPAIVVENMASTNTLVVDSETYFCNESSSAGATYTSILNDLSTNVIFNPSDMDEHVNNTDIGSC